MTEKTCKALLVAIVTTLPGLALLMFAMHVKGTPAVKAAVLIFGYLAVAAWTSWRLWKRFDQ